MSAPEGLSGKALQVWTDAEAMVDKWSIEHGGILDTIEKLDLVFRITNLMIDSELRAVHEAAEAMRKIFDKGGK